MKDAADIIADVCAAIVIDPRDEAENILRDNYPFAAVKKKKFSVSRKQKMEIFLRDGFVDGYSGERLIFPGTLLVPSEKLGVIAEF